MRGILITSNLLLSLMWGASFATAQTTASRTTSAPKDPLSGLADEALRAHPSLIRLAARVRVAGSKIKQVRAWPDPKLAIGLSNMPFSPFRFNASPMTGLQISLTQPLPYFARFSRAAKVAEARTAVAKAALAEARHQLRGMVRATLWELSFLAADVRITRQHGVLLERLIKVVIARYRVNAGPLTDSLKARVARTRIDDRLEGIKLRRLAVSAALAALLGRKTPGRLPTPTLPAVRALTRSVDQYMTLAERQRPLLGKWRRRIHVARAQRALAKTAYYPTFGVSLGYRIRDNSLTDPVTGMDFWSLGVTMSIPLWSLGKTRGRIRQADAARAAGEAGLRAARLQIRKEIRLARDAIRSLDRRILIYQKRLLPQGRLALDAGIAAYATGKTSFMSLLDQQRVLFNDERRLWRLRVNRAQAWERLRTAVGRVP